MKTTIANKSWFHDSDLRLDASFHLSETNQIKHHFKHSPYNFTALSHQSIEVFSGNIFKRIFVKDENRGLPYLTGSDIIKADVDSGKFISKKQAHSLQRLILKEGWILVTCSGTLGNVVYTNKIFEGRIATHDLIRIVPNNKDVKPGFLYAYLASRYGYALLTQSSYGGVVKHIEPHHIKNLPIPIFPPDKQQQIHDFITQSAELCVEANNILAETQSRILKINQLEEISPEDYDYYGPRSSNRITSTFTKNIRNIDSTSLNAFNHSQRISRTIDKIMHKCRTLALYDTLDDNKFFTTGSFPRLEVKAKKGIRLINQSDIFDRIIKGKWISSRKVVTNGLVNYGEVMIASVGTLGDTELFCRVIFANEDIQGQLVSGEFIRMNTNKNIPSGYLFAWLNSNYGFRLIRSTQSGTKQCRPIHRLLKKIPVPIIKDELMCDIHNDVVKAHTLRHNANLLELKAINIVENEIDQWHNLYKQSTARGQ